ncbi:hypothetical protein R9C62_002717 [Enterobacter hormaechei]|nr:hypothetical protein [Enterobacter hormaechei]
MSTLTKEWLMQTITELEEERDATPGAVNVDAANALAAMKLALASLETEAVGYIDAEYAELLKSGHIQSCSVYAEPGKGCIPVYTAPPVPTLTDSERQELQDLRNEYALRRREWAQGMQHDPTFGGILPKL